MVELVDTTDLKSVGVSRAGSTPASGTTFFKGENDESVATSERAETAESAMNDQMERALRLQLIHIDVWLEHGQRADTAPAVLRAVRSIAASALTPPTVNPPHPKGGEND